MSSTFKEFNHLQISLKDIKSATNNFGETNRIGRGGFGAVYKGELVISDNLTMVAMKRLDTKLGQGAPEFWREIMLLSTYKHENLVSLLGFCDEGGENILVYEFLSNKSLDLYLSSPNLSWNQRLRICIGAAKGLEYLHTPAQGSQHRVLHRDIKSANILLDHNWNSKVADFGLSKFGLANQPVTYQFSTPVGTMGYCDPLYMHTGLLTKESDVYSFGVVLFEVLCGRQCVQFIKGDNRPKYLTALALKCDEEKTLSTIISTSLKEKISSGCLERFSNIAFRCLKLERTQRPSITEIVKQLHIALDYQDEHELEMNMMSKLPLNMEEISEMLNIPHAIYSVKKDLFFFLQKGHYFDGNKQYFWIKEDGKQCVLISIEKVLSPMNAYLQSTQKFFKNYHSRFKKVAVINRGSDFYVKCDIKTSMLSLGTWYAVRLIFKVSEVPKTYSMKLTKIKWKTEDLSVCSTHVAKLRDDNWYSIYMWNFFNHMPVADFEILLEELLFLDLSLYNNDLIIQGFEFQPTNMMQHATEDMDKDDEEYWEKKLPHDYQRLIRMSEEPLKYTTKKELYSRLCEGFLGHHGERRLWVFLHKSNPGICFMLPANEFIYVEQHHEVHAISGSRFHEVIYITSSTDHLHFLCSLESVLMFTPHYIYTCYLVFKFQENQTLTDDRNCYGVLSIDGNVISYTDFGLEMHAFNIPSIKPISDDGSHDSSDTEMQKDNLYNESCTPIDRKDGWMEFMLSKPLHQLQDCKLLNVLLHVDESFDGMIIQGIEFRPSS